ncbi:hypothetical protein CC2G_000995 [Coprinopsis cinerea AmutBmut pab1-1]|nr:hypothetical protein CC2G_000995 [Coprinopsis cinerea AmutBmut pab1-1]
MSSTSHPWPHSSTTSDESDDDDIQIIYGNGAQSESTRRDVQMDNWPSTTTGSISSHLVSTTTAGAPSPSVAPALAPSGASIMNAKDSDHTLAAITLAFANGAGSINDYASIVHSDPHHNGFSHDAGDLWR